MCVKHCVFRTFNRRTIIRKAVSLYLYQMLKRRQCILFISLNGLLNLLQKLFHRGYRTYLQKSMKALLELSLDLRPLIALGLHSGRDNIQVQLRGYIYVGLHQGLYLGRVTLRYNFGATHRSGLHLGTFGATFRYNFGTTFRPGDIKVQLWGYIQIV